MRYRVISDGDVYRVQYRRCFIWWTWSEASVEEGWGPSPFEFQSAEEASRAFQQRKVDHWRVVPVSSKIHPPEPWPHK